MTPTIRDAFLQGMSRTAQTVTIVTTDGPAGRAGVTVSAMVSVSADAAHPTLLVCINHTAQAAPRIMQNGTFCVNVLQGDQSHIADVFAGRFADQWPDKFDVAAWQAMPLGAPRLQDPLVAFDCKLSQHSRIGTHHVFIAEVQSVYLSPQGTALIYANRAYGTPTRMDVAHSPVGQRANPSRALVMAGVTDLGAFVLPKLLQGLSGPDIANLTVIEGDQRRVVAALQTGEAELALMLDHGLPADVTTVPLQNLLPHVLVDADHALARQLTLTPQDLTPQDLAPFFLVLLDSQPWSGLALDLMRDAGMTPLIAGRAASVAMVRAMVGQGLGPAVVFLPAGHIGTDDGTLTIPLSGTSQRAGLVLGHRQGVPLSPQGDLIVQRAQSLSP